MIIKQAINILSIYEAVPEDLYGFRYNTLDDEGREKVDKAIDLIHKHYGSSIHGLSTFCGRCTKKILDVLPVGYSWDDIFFYDYDDLTEAESCNFCDVCGKPLVTYPASPCYYDYEFTENWSVDMAYECPVEAYILRLGLEAGDWHDDDCMEKQMNHAAANIVRWSKTRKGKRYLGRIIRKSAKVRSKRSRCGHCRHFVLYFKGFCQWFSQAKDFSEPACGKFVLKQESEVLND